MARNTGGSRSSSPPGGNAQLIMGILIGMVLGLAVAGGVAWQISKSPSPFLNKEQRLTVESKPEAVEPPPTVAVAPAVKPAAPAAPAPQPAATAEPGKQRFEFYHVLTEKDGAATAPKGSGKPAPVPHETAPAAGGSYYLQAASFTTAEEADKLKARLALSGLEASIQAANVPDMGVRYRVRLGPYHSAEELRRANETLKQNGISNAAQVH